MTVRSLKRKFDETSFPRLSGEVFQQGLNHRWQNLCYLAAGPRTDVPTLPNKFGIGSS